MGIQIRISYNLMLQNIILLISFNNLKKQETFLVYRPYKNSQPARTAEWFPNLWHY